MDNPLSSAELELIILISMYAMLFPLVACLPQEGLLTLARQHLRDGDIGRQTHELVGYVVGLEAPYNALNPAAYITVLPVDTVDHFSPTP